jgi:hypothetical protein
MVWLIASANVDIMEMAKFVQVSLWMQTTNIPMRYSSVWHLNRTAPSNTSDNCGLFLYKVEKKKLK